MRRSRVKHSQGQLIWTIETRGIPLCGTGAAASQLRRTLSPHLLQSDSLMTEKPILVTAGIIRHGDRVLICQRHHSDAYGMQWEFPGGK